ncbi:MAG: VapC toxin family PIN domain ribonuclease [Dehalococcoidia bacterium]|nr:VapC toxin family PIN domain ribonuclease [Dehalococcoidia bacterium]
MTTYLLDVNLLLALSDPMHVHHEVAHEWFADRGHISWATCPIAENGFIRIASHPSYPNRPGDVLAVTAILRQFCELPGHQFSAEDISVLAIMEPSAIITHAQITDVYLAGLASHKKGRLATLDQHIPVAAVRGGKGALEIIPRHL